jgi:uracil phosphoribosyltransferase
MAAPPSPAAPPAASPAVAPLVGPHAHGGRLVVHDHPVLHHKLAVLRDPDTRPRDFRARLSEIAALMTYTATRHLPVEEVELLTPLERTRGRVLAAPVTVVPILRAGLAMADGVLMVFPEARVGHLGLARDERSLQPRAYLDRLPADVGAGPVLLVDPMLATGGSAVAALHTLRAAGARDVLLLCLVAAPEGVDRVLEADLDVSIHCAALDRQLDPRGYILPGLGDAGDRAFGTT